MLRAVGFGDDDFTKPIIGVANGYSNLTPCNVGLGDLSERQGHVARAVTHWERALSLKPEEPEKVRKKLARYASRATGAKN